MKHFPFISVLLIITSINFSCSKDSDNSNPSAFPGDAVVGSYLAVTVPPNYITGSATVSKTGAGKYQFTPGSASMPSFTFQYEAVSSFFISPNFAYSIPRQNSNAILLDSAYFTFYTGARTISLTLTSVAAGTSWMYDAVKQ